MKLSSFFQKLHKKVRFLLNETGYTCDYCGAEVFSYPTERLCVSCEEKLGKNDGKTCIKCGRKTVTEGVCLTCKSALPSFSAGYASFVYRGEVASLVNRMKNSTPRLACYLGERMVEYLLEKRADIAETQMPVLVLPIPLTEKRERERGYNQAYLLAENVCKRLKELGVQTELSKDALQKVKDTEMQKHMTRKERAENVKGAFHLHKRKLCRDRKVILIDDIMTTGATASECAEKIIGAGAQEVMLLVAAALPERK